jgi:hypothetical protein
MKKRKFEIDCLITDEWLLQIKRESLRVIVWFLVNHYCRSKDKVWEWLFDSWWKIVGSQEEKVWEWLFDYQIMIIADEKRKFESDCLITD